MMFSSLKKMFWLFWPMMPLPLRTKLSTLIEAVNKRCAQQVPHSAIEVVTYSEAAFLQAKQWETINGVSVTLRELAKSLPPFSLITTCYNEGASVERWLDSVLLLEVLPQDLVICDGGSNDDTVQRIKRWLALHPTTDLKIEVISGKRRNIAAGRNEAMKHAKCEIVLCSDVGTTLHPQWSAKLVAPFSFDSDLDGVFGWYQSFDSNLSANAKALHALIGSELSDINPATFLPSARSIAFKRDIYWKIGGYPEDLTRAGEDTLFDIALKKHGGKFSFVPEAYVVWQPPQSMGATLKTVFSYSRGDGEAGLFWSHYLGQLHNLIAIFLDISVAKLLLFLFGAKAVILATVFICSATFFAARMLKPYVERIKKREVVTSEVVPWLLAFLFALAQSAGFIRGLLKRRS